MIFNATTGFKETEEAKDNMPFDFGVFSLLSKESFPHLVTITIKRGEEAFSHCDFMPDDVIPIYRGGRPFKVKCRDVKLGDRICNCEVVEVIQPSAKKEFASERSKSAFENFLKVSKVNSYVFDDWMYSEFLKKLGSMKDDTQIVTLMRKCGIVECRVEAPRLTIFCDGYNTCFEVSLGDYPNVKHTVVDVTLLKDDLIKIYEKFPKVEVVR